MGAELVRFEAFPVDIIAPAADLASRIAKTEFVPSALRNRPEAVLAAILSGHEIGIGPMQALAKIHVIEGRPTQAAELMRALVLSKGHELIVEDYTQTRVILCGRRSGSDHVTKVQWDMDMAKKAGLASKQNWQKYPRAMLLARATGELCRLIFADVIGGISYTPEELTDGDVIIYDEEPPLELAEPAKATATRKAATRKAAAPTKATAPEAAAPEPPALPGEDGFEDLGATATPGESDEIVTKRAQQIAMRCQEAGLDNDGRHHLISAITNGVKTSAREVTGEEGAEVISAAREIAAGRLSLAERDGGWDLVPVEDATGDQDDGAADADDFEAVGDEDQWDADKWRKYLAARDVKGTALIRRAQELAAEMGEEPPTNLSALHGRSSLCGLLRGWVEEQFEERAGQ